MTKSCKVTLELLRKAFNPEYDCRFDSDINWAEVIEVASEQGVLGVCFEAVERLAPNQRPDMDNLMDWLGQVEYMKTCYEEHRKVIGHLAELCQEQCVKMLLLKGFGLSLNYPVPEHRPTGDIDTYLFGAQEKLDAVIAEKGIKIDKDNAHHSSYSFEGVSVENHCTLLDVNTHQSGVRMERMFQKMLNEERAYKKSPIPNCFIPSATLNAIYLIRHAGIHFVSEKISLRHVLDVGCFFTSHSAEIDWNYVLKVYKDENMVNFYNAISTICVRDLGMNPDDFKGYCDSDNLAKRLLTDIFSKEEQLAMSVKGITGWKRISYAIKKSKRFWNNRWKHKMVFKDGVWYSFIALATNRLKSFRDD